MRFTTLALLLIASPAFAAPTVVEDFANGSQDPSVHLLKLTDEQKNRIIRALSPVYVRSDASDPNATLQECSDFEDLSAIRGHFSSTYAEEILIVFDSFPCYDDIAINHHGNAVLLDSDYRATEYKHVDADTIEKVLDIDGDGLSEVITSYEYNSHGDHTTYAETLTFQNGIEERVMSVARSATTTVPCQTTQKSTPRFSCSRHPREIKPTNTTMSLSAITFGNFSRRENCDPRLKN